MNLPIARFKMTFRDVIFTFIGSSVIVLLCAIRTCAEWDTESKRVYVRVHYRCNDKVIDMPTDMTLVKCEYDITSSNSTVTCHFAPTPKGTADASR